MQLAGRWNTLVMSLVGGALVGLAIPVFGQNQSQEADPHEQLFAPADEMRTCLFREDQPEIPADGLIFHSSTLGNNPQEGIYQEEMERLLRIEIRNVADAVADATTKHRELARLFPSYSRYYEIALEDDPGTWNGNDFVNYKKVIAFHFDVDGKMSCIVLDAERRSIYMETAWTRKLMRLYLPENIQSIELHTFRHNYQTRNRLDEAAAEVQLEALRMVYLDLRSALYRMDMQIAAFYDRRNQLNSWQVDLD